MKPPRKLMWVNKGYKRKLNEMIKGIIRNIKIPFVTYSVPDIK
jgi:hypothetical protein